MQWPKILDTIIAGIPDNARYRLELGKLREQFEALEAENRALKSQVAALQPKTGLDAAAGKILKYLFDLDDSGTPEFIAHVFSMQPSVAKYHCDSLMARDLIEYEFDVIRDDAPRRVKITGEGRAFVVRNGLT